MIFGHVYLTVAVSLLCFPLQRVKRDLKRAISVHDGKAALLPMSRSEVTDLEATLEHSLAHKKQLEAKLTETRLEVR